MTKRDKRWAPSDDERLLKFSDAGTPLPVIAITLGWTRAAVESQLLEIRQSVRAAIDSMLVRLDESANPGRPIFRLHASRHAVD